MPQSSGTDSSAISFLPPSLHRVVAVRRVDRELEYIDAGSHCGSFARRTVHFW
jgi:hypothetical protein